MIKECWLRFTVLALVAAPGVAFSQESNPPRTLLGFLQPGMQVGVQTVDGSTDVLLGVYAKEWSSVTQALAAERVPPNAASFVSEYPAARGQYEEFVASLRKDSPDAEVEDIVVFPLLRTSVVRITAVGEDYVLVERLGSEKRQLVIAASAISRIDLAADPLRFYHQSSR